MKKQTYIILLLLFSLGSHAQTWQWQKRGGGSQNLYNSIGPNIYQKESVIDMVTDSNNNVYTLSVVQKNNLNVDGNPKTHLGQYQDSQAILVSSFSCNGTYRWSKIFTSPGGTEYPQMVIDNQNNIYVAGFINPIYNCLVPPCAMFDTDATINFTVTTTPTSMSCVNCNTVFLIKYNSNGEFQWIRHPEEPNKTSEDFVNYPYQLILGMDMDTNGIIHMVCKLYPDVWGTGPNSYTVQAADAEKLHVLKYDTAGNFMGGVGLNFKPPVVSISQIRFLVNKVTNDYVFGLFRENTNGGADDQAYINGTQLVGRSAWFAFNNNGVFQWKFEHLLQNAIEPPYDYMIRDIKMYDTTGNMIIFGNVTKNCQYDTHIASDKTYLDGKLIMKISPTGNYLDSNYSDSNITYGGFNASGVIKNNIIAMGTHSNGFDWDGVYSPIVASGGNASIFLFDKNTLELLKADEIPAPNYDEEGTAIAADNLGNFYVGGHFEGNQTVNGQTQYSNGGESDFFVAKYGSANCSCQAPTCSFKPKKSTTLNYAYNFTYIGQNVYSSVLWDFGDGTTSTETNPSHTYTTPGTYTVCVTATNSCDSFQYCKQVTATVLEAHQPFLEELTFMPNPVVDVLQFSQLDEYVIYTLYNLNGQIVDKGDMSPNQPQINLERITPGNYIIKLENKDKQIKTIKVIKE